MPVSKDGNHYERDGRLYTRVTRVLDYFQTPELVDWKIKVGKREAKRVSTIALKTGTRVHEACEQLLKGVAFDDVLRAGDSIEAVNAVKAFDDWMSSYMPKGVKMEQTLFCDDRLIAGTYDLIVDSLDTLIDMKSSTRIGHSYWLQLGAYWSMLPGLMCDRPKYGAILRLDKTTGMYEYVRTETDEMPYKIEALAAMYDEALSLYRFFNRPSALRAELTAEPE
jgi:hypothetical protein